MKANRFQSSPLSNEERVLRAVLILVLLSILDSFAKLLQ